jgi:photosystem II stability/assembly factor-like uncharacterized protein
MLDPDVVSVQEQLLAAHRQTLSVYLRQLAELGILAPPGVFNGITETRAAIGQIKRTLRAAGATVTDNPDDEPAALLPSEHATPLAPTNEAGDSVSGDNVGRDKKGGERIDNRRGVFVDGGTLNGPIIGEQYNYYPPSPIAADPVSEERVVLPPWTIPDQRTDLRAWWRWLHQYRRVAARGALGLAVVYLLVAMLVQWPPFQPRRGWGALGPTPPVKALALKQIGGVLLLGSATVSAGCSLDTGIWRSLDGGQRWEAVPAPLAMSEGLCPRLAAVKAFAHSPAAARRIYAATSDMGLLRSDGSPEIGKGWVALGTKQLPAQLRNVVVLPTDAEQLFVAAEPGNLFHSANGGKSWRQLDGKETCADPTRGFSLPAAIDPQAMLATRDAVYVGTFGSLTAASRHAGLYASTDGGNCWHLLQDGNKRYRYLGLAERSPGAVVALTYDFQGLDGEEFQLWEIGASAGQPDLLWQSGSRAVDVYIDARAPQTWYIIDGTGALLAGSFGAGPQQRPEALARVTRCILPCNFALAPDLDTHTTSVPLLLAEDRVYRLGQVPWYRAIWP